MTALAVYEADGNKMDTLWLLVEVFCRFCWRMLVPENLQVGGYEDNMLLLNICFCPTQFIIILMYFYSLLDALCVFLIGTCTEETGRRMETAHTVSHSNSHKFPDTWSFFSISKVGNIFICGGHVVMKVKVHSCSLLLLRNWACLAGLCSESLFLSVPDSTLD